MLEIAHGVVNDDCMFSTLMVVDRIAAKPSPQVDKPVGLSDTLKQALQDMRLRPLLVVPSSPKVTVVVVIFVIVGKYGTNLFLVNLMFFLNNHSSPLIHIMHNHPTSLGKRERQGDYLPPRQGPPCIPAGEVPCYLSPGQGSPYSRNLLLISH